MKEIGEEFERNYNACNDIELFPRPGESDEACKIRTDDCIDRAYNYKIEMEHKMLELYEELYAKALDGDNIIDDLLLYSEAFCDDIARLPDTDGALEEYIEDVFK